MSFFGIFRNREKRVKLYEEKDKNIIEAIGAKIKELRQPATQTLQPTTQPIEKEKERKKIKVLVYNPSKYFERDIAFYKIGVELDKALSLEEYFLKISTKEYTSILIIPNDDIKDKNSLINMIKEPKLKNRNTQILLVGPHQFTTQAISYGVDYFIISDKDRKLEYLGLKNMNVIKTGLIYTIWKRLIEKENLTQSETELVIEKKEFYESVKDIFNIRAKQTADVTKEVKFLNEKLKQFNCKNILDAGCGNGRLTEPLANLGFIMTGIDITDSLLKSAKSQKGNSTNYIKPKYINMSILKTEFKSKEFDAVILMWHVICELKQYQDEIFTDVYRILNNKGIIIFDFPDIENYKVIKRDGTYEDAGAGLLKYRGIVPEIDKILDILESKGFQIIEYHWIKWGINKCIVVARKVQ